MESQDLKIKVQKLETIVLPTTELEKLREKIEVYLNANILAILNEIKNQETESLSKGYGYCKPEFFAATMTKGLIFSSGSEVKLEWPSDYVIIEKVNVSWRGISVVLTTQTGFKISIYSRYCDEEDLEKITPQEFQTFEKWRKLYMELIMSELPNAIASAFDNLFERLYEHIKYRVKEEIKEEIIKELVNEEENEEEEEPEQVQDP